MESPPPEVSPRSFNEERDQHLHIAEPPSTPRGASKRPVCQQPTPMSPTPNGNAQLMVVFDYNHVRHRVNFSEYKKITPLPSPITPGQPIIPYDTKSRDTGMNDAKAWLATSASDEQRRQRTDALVKALLHNSHKFTSVSRGLRANGERDPWSDTEDEDESDSDNEDDKEGLLQPHNNPSSPPQPRPTEKSSEEPVLRMLGEIPEIGTPGINTEEDFRIIQNFRNTHNVAVTSAACGQLVFPQLGPRPSPPQPQQSTPTREPVALKFSYSSSSDPDTPTKTKTAPKHRIIKTPGKVHGPTGNLILLNDDHIPIQDASTTNPRKKRKYTKRSNNKNPKPDNDTDFNPSSENGVPETAERTANVTPGRRNPTRSTSAACKKAAKGGRRGRKRGRPVGSKNKPKTVSQAQREMLMGFSKD